MLVGTRKVRDPAWKSWHHHTLIYDCTKAPTPRPTAGTRVPQDGCSEIIFLPGDSYVLPDSAPKLGMLIGDDSDIKGFRIEVHYDALWAMQGKTVDPGVGYLIDVAPDDGTYTPLGSITTGTLSLALPSLLPRGDKRLHMWGSCAIPDDVPADGVNVLYNMFHMHLQGKQIWMSHIAGPAWGADEGKELSELGRHNYYDWNFQGAGGFPPQGKKLLAGDTLIVHCRFDSTNNVNRAKHGGLELQPNVTTTFGEGTMDEMCFDFVSYYPRVPGLATCFRQSGKGDPLAVAAPPAKNLSLSDQFDGQSCSLPDPRLATMCTSAAHCFRSPTAGGTFCNGTSTSAGGASGLEGIASLGGLGGASGLAGGLGGLSGAGGLGGLYGSGGVGGLVDSCPAALVALCSDCYPHSECGRTAEALTYTPKSYVPRTCVMGESASEVAGLKPPAYWSSLQVQQTSLDKALMGTTASKCKATDKSVTDKSGDNQALVIGLSAAAAVIFVAVASLGFIYYKRHCHAAFPTHEKASTQYENEVTESSASTRPRVRRAHSTSQERDKLRCQSTWRRHPGTPG